MNLIQTLKTYLLICMSIGMLAVASCKKQDKATPKPIETVDEEIPIPILKLYLSSLIGIDTAELAYNQQTTYFQWRGVNQITREKLSFSYKLNNKAK